MRCGEWRSSYVHIVHTVRTYTHVHMYIRNTVLGSLHCPKEHTHIHYSKADTQCTVPRSTHTYTTANLTLTKTQNALPKRECLLSACNTSVRTGYYSTGSRRSTCNRGHTEHCADIRTHVCTHNNNNNNNDTQQQHTENTHHTVLQLTLAQLTTFWRAHS